MKEVYYDPMLNISEEREVLASYLGHMLLDLIQRAKPNEIELQINPKPNCDLRVMVFKDQRRAARDYNYSHMLIDLKGEPRRNAQHDSFKFQSILARLP